MCVCCRQFCGSHVRVSEDGLSARKNNASVNYSGGVVYSDRPLRRHCEFEVTLTEYGTGWSGNFKLGIVFFHCGKSTSR